MMTPDSARAGAKARTRSATGTAAAATPAPRPTGRPAADAASASAGSAAMRRRPRQARSLERVARILDAAEAVFAEVGYEAATTNAIAAQAQTSIGSLYEFFPNKESLAHALAERYIERIGRLYDELIVDDPAAEGPQIVEQIIAGLDRFYRDHPGAVPLLNGRFTSPELAEAGEALQSALVRHVESLIAARRTALVPARVTLVAQVTAEIARSLLVLAGDVALHRRKAVMRELELAVNGYLREHFRHESLDYDGPAAAGPATAPAPRSTTRQEPA